MKKKFEVFDPFLFEATPWVAKLLDDAFADPKGKAMWDAREADQGERMNALALGIKQFLAQLPDGTEIGTAALAERLHPGRYDEFEFRKFLINRIGQLRFYELLNGFYCTLPDRRWKKPRTFYKYHNGKGKTDGTQSQSHNPIL